MINAKACADKAMELDDRAEACFSAEAADEYRLMAVEWRKLQAQAAAQDAWMAEHP